MGMTFSEKLSIFFSSALPARQTTYLRFVRKSLIFEKNTKPKHKGHDFSWKIKHFYFVGGRSKVIRSIRKKIVAGTADQRSYLRFLRNIIL